MIEERVSGRVQVDLGWRVRQKITRSKRQEQPRLLLTTTPVMHQETQLLRPPAVFENGISTVVSCGRAAHHCRVDAQGRLRQKVAKRERQQP